MFVGARSGIGLPVTANPFDTLWIFLCLPSCFVFVLFFSFIDGTLQDTLKIAWFLFVCLNAPVVSVLSLSQARLSEGALLYPRWGFRADRHVMRHAL